MKTASKQQGFVHAIIAVVVIVLVVTGAALVKLLSSNSQSAEDIVTTVLEDTGNTDTDPAHHTASENINHTDETQSGNQPQETQPSTAPTTTPQPTPAPTPTPTPSPTPSPTVKRNFTINAFNYGYTPNSMQANVGDEVTITLTNSGGSHDLVIEGLWVATDVISKGNTDTVTFTVPASAAGKTYTFYCSVGNHRAQGMVGSFVVGN